MTDILSNGLMKMKKRNFKRELEVNQILSKMKNENNEKTNSLTNLTKQLSKKVKIEKTQNNKKEKSYEMER